MAARGHGHSHNCRGGGGHAHSHGGGHSHSHHGSGSSSGEHLVLRRNSGLYMQPWLAAICQHKSEDGALVVPPNHSGHGHPQHVADKSSSKHYRIKGTDIGVLFVSGVSAIIVIGLPGAWFFVFIPLKEYFVTTLGQIGLYLLHVLAAMAILTYIKTVRTNPGIVGPKWSPSEADISVNIAEERAGLTESDSSAHWCGKCRSYRPDRSHHCSGCDRCILMMDHHCVFVNNCIGHRNIKMFYLWLGYSATIGWLSFIFILVRFWDIWGKYNELDAYTFRTSVLAGSCLLFLDILCSLPLCAMFTSMTQCLMYNTTNVERRFLTLRMIETESRFPNPVKYQRHLRNNLMLVLGKNPLLWLWPTIPSTDPYNYPEPPIGDEERERIAEEKAILIRKKQEDNDIEIGGAAV